METWAGIAPAHGGFADPCLTTWLPGHSKWVGGNGVEPFTSYLSDKRSTAELTAQTHPILSFMLNFGYGGKVKA